MITAPKHLTNLQWVLDYLVEANDIVIISEIAQGKKTTEHEAEQLLEHIRRDGYADSNGDKNSYLRTYWVNGRGKVFHETSGYDESRGHAYIEPGISVHPPVRHLPESGPKWFMPPPPGGWWHRRRKWWLGLKTETKVSIIALFVAGIAVPILIAFIATPTVVILPARPDRSNTPDTINTVSQPQSRTNLPNVGNDAKSDTGESILAPDTTQAYKYSISPGYRRAPKDSVKTDTTP